jgi:Outer membrane lipoprotein-sorting protein
LVRFWQWVAATVVALGIASDLRAEATDATAPAAKPLTANEIDECVRANLPNETTRQFISFKLTDRLGLVDESTVETFWKKFPDGKWRLLARFLGPENVRGTAVLIFERDYGSDIFVYLPELHRVRRIHKRSVHGAVAGTDLSYEDWERLQGLRHDPHLRRLPDSAIEGREVYVIEATADPTSDTSYTRIVSWIDHRTCVALRIEIYETGDRLRKVVTVPADAIWPESDGWITRYTRVEDRREGSQTEISVADVVMDEPLPDRYFTQKILDAEAR